MSLFKKEELKQLMEEVKENLRRLRECEKHDFVLLSEDGPMLYHKFVCRNCEGQINRHDYLWYQRGVKDGKKSCPTG